MLFEIAPDASAIDVSQSAIANKVRFPEQQIVAHPGGVKPDAILRAHVVNREGKVIKTIEKPKPESR